MGTQRRPEDLYCSFCNKNGADVQKLIAAPDGVICDECMECCCELVQRHAPQLYGPRVRQVFARIASGRPPSNPAASKREIGIYAVDPETEGTRLCSFCGKRPKEVAVLVGHDDRLSICDECLDLCVDILDDEADKGG